MENTENKINTSTLYKTAWRAYYKPGLSSPKIVYGETEDIARRNALAEYRFHAGAVDLSPMDKIVDRVEPIA
jgi:hypothetical protein